MTPFSWKSPSKERWIVVVQIDVLSEFSRVCELAGILRGEAALLMHAREVKARIARRASSADPRAIS